MVKVSVIIPVYNKEKYLSRTIESCLGQSLKDIEIVLVNDGSTDSSLEICRYYEKKDSRIIVVNQKNQGVSAARNQGILHATGDYIGFVDADDTIDKDMYLNMYNQCENDNSDACMCNYIEYNINMDKIYSKISIDSEDEHDRKIINRIIADMIAPSSFDGIGNVIMGSACRFLIKKDILINESIGFIEGIPLMEDLIFCIDLLAKVNSLSIDHAYYYHYYTIENSASKQYRKDYYENAKNVTNYLINVLTKKNKYSVFEERINNRIFLTSMGSIVNVMNMNNKSSVLKKLRDIKEICSNPKLKKAMAKIKKNELSKKNRFKFEAMYHEKISLLYVYHFIVVRRAELVK